MEIRVRTYDETSSERVRIEVAPGQRATIQVVDGERVTAKNLPSRNLYTDEEVAENEEYHLARIAEHRRSLATRDRLLSAATTRINAVREILLSPRVTEVRNEIVTTKGAILADAIGNALHALEG